jgi:phosphopantetheinyl transferase
MEPLSLADFLTHPRLEKRANISLVIVNLPKSGFPESLGSVLSSEENAISSESSRISRALARICLQAETGLQAKDLKIERSANGKPQLLNSGISYSVSHSGSLWALACSSHYQVALDLETAKDHPRLLKIASRFFFESEKSYLKTLPHDQAESAALQMWTAKEALIKLHGITLFQGLPQYEIALDPIRCITGPDLQFEALKGEGFVATIALKPLES